MIMMNSSRIANVGCVDDSKEVEGGFGICSCKTSEVE